METRAEDAVATEGVWSVFVWRELGGGHEITRDFIFKTKAEATKFYDAASAAPGGAELCCPGQRLLRNTFEDNMKIFRRFADGDPMIPEHAWDDEEEDEDEEEEDEDEEECCFYNFYICRHCFAFGTDDPDCDKCGKEMCVLLYQEANAALALAKAKQ